MLPTRLSLYRLRVRLTSAVLTAGGTILLLFASVVAGWASAWYMVDAGSRLTTSTIGPWVSWGALARPDADPYTRAHLARAGSLHLNANIASTWQARADNNGQRLHSSCDYAITGSLDASWWSLSVFDDRGRLISNAAERYGYTSDTIALGADGRFSITLGRDARPGNWVPTGGAGRLAIMLTMQDRRSALSEDGQGATMRMPEIRRLVCR